MCTEERPCINCFTDKGPCMDIEIGKKYKVKESFNSMRIVKGSIVEVLEIRPSDHPFVYCFGSNGGSALININNLEKFKTDKQGREINNKTTGKVETDSVSGSDVHELVRHYLEYCIFSAKVSWCNICKQHFYNSGNTEHTTKATAEHFHIVGT